METTEIIIKLVTPLIPIVILLIGGQRLLNNYSIAKKRRESEIELISAIRNEQYATLDELYKLFAKFMELYRKINSPVSEFESPESRKEIFSEIVKAESAIDAIVLKIGCEFAKEGDNQEELESMLGNLRQSVQIWRESFVNDNKLPFSISTQEDYLRFKSAFSSVSAFLINRLHQNIEPHKAKMKRVESLLVGAFHHKHEKWKWGHFYTGG
ncbi:MAG: hypothetical protein AAFR61_26685 [Bacteroidota bacterium]